MEKLDRTKPYMEAYGPNLKYRYIQEWRYYNKDGDLVDEQGNLLAPEAASKQPNRQQEESSQPVKEPDPVQVKQQAALTCPICGFVAANQWAANAHKRTHEK